MEVLQRVIALLVTFSFLYNFFSYLRFRKKMNKLVKRIAIRFNLADYEVHEKLYRAYKLMKPEQFKNAKREVNSFNSDTPIPQIADIMIKLTFTVGVAVFAVLATSTASLIDLLINNDKLIEDPNFDLIEHLVSFIEIFMKISEASHLFIWLGTAVFIIISSYLFFFYLEKRIHKYHLDAVNEIMDERKNDLYYQ